MILIFIVVIFSVRVQFAVDMSVVYPIAGSDKWEVVGVGLRLIIVSYYELVNIMNLAACQ